jgi:Ni/Fe-hydrogenase subunit HybB-like protein
VTPYAAAAPVQRQRPAPAAPDDLAMIDRALAPLTVTPTAWKILFAICALGSVIWLAAVAYTIRVGIGAWGNNMPVAWAFAIVNFVWWIGIGHAGTFISAFLLLLNQPWRAAVGRMAEAMTLIAVAIAATFPLLHLGRPWFFYWLVPYPSTMGVWPNFKSALTWDVAAIGSYFVVSAIFFYLGLIPDLATARDRLAPRRRRRLYGVFALGWNGAGRQWRRRRAGLKIIAGIAAALVVSVHSIVSLDFSTAQLSGWHSTIFPPYFVVGAIYSGLAMVLVLAVPVRAAYRLQSIVTLDHLERLAKLLLTVGLLLAYCYAVELFVASYTSDARERTTYFVHRPFGPFGWLYWSMLALNLLTPQVFWFARCRRRVGVLFGAGVAILLGMWIERFVIVVSSLSQSALPSSWFDYVPTSVDWGILLGSLSLFGLVFLLFLRFVPAVALAELRRHRFEETTEAAG